MSVIWGVDSGVGSDDIGMGVGSGVVKFVGSGVGSNLSWDIGLGVGL